jgi:Flp pilus assembly protein TadB
MSNLVEVVAVVGVIATAMMGRTATRITVSGRQGRLLQSRSIHEQARPRRRTRFRRESIDADMIEALTTIGRSVRSGTSLGMAIVQVGHSLPDRAVGIGFMQVQMDAERIGLLDALRDWGKHDPRCARTAWALAITAQTGGDATAAIDALISSLRSGQSLQRELGALTAQSTLSAAVLALVPIVFAGLLSGTDPQARAFLFTTAPGQVCLFVGLALNMIAWRWLRRIAAITI